MNKLNIKGLIAAPFTPMFEDMSIHTGAIKKYAKKLIEDGVKGVFVCGTTGEGLLMDSEERKQVVEEWLKYQSDSFKIIVHVGSTSIVTASKLARHAQEVGADAIATMGPSFLPPNKVEPLVDYCEIVAKSASKIPFYYYHMPQVSNVDVSMLAFLEEGEKRIPTLAGIKFTNNNLMELQQLLNYKDGKFEIFHGYDEVLLAGLVLGAKGAVGSTYNYMSKIYRELIQNFESGNLLAAREIQLYSVKVVEVLIKYGGGVRAGKEIMNLCGIECGPLRSPFIKFTKKESEELKRDLEVINFFE